MGGQTENTPVLLLASEVGAMPACSARHAVSKAAVDAADPAAGPRASTCRRTGRRTPSRRRRTRRAGSPPCRGAGPGSKTVGVPAVGGHPPRPRHGPPATRPRIRRRRGPREPRCVSDDRKSRPGSTGPEQIPYRLLPLRVHCAEATRRDRVSTANIRTRLATSVWLPGSGRRATASHGNDATGV